MQEVLALALESVVLGLERGLAVAAWALEPELAVPVLGQVVWALVQALEPEPVACRKNPRPKATR